MNTYIAIGAALAAVVALYVVGRMLYRNAKYGEEAHEYWLVALIFAIVFMMFLWPVCWIFFLKDRD